MNAFANLIHVQTLFSACKATQFGSGNENDAQKM